MIQILPLFERTKRSNKNPLEYLTFFYVRNIHLCTGKKLHVNFGNNLKHGNFFHQRQYF